ncbi:MULTISPECIES: hypothetical protein [Halomonadaceae]|uniref:hypothetical protein n=1 Tax=Halomonadaceae TaxID=28256 RepID=UPI0015814D0E|nr:MULTISPECIES: hypothetical protein [Halomonas]MDI4637911.1 hypothetical protein [Halomonas sp. BMC7]NUJ61357.1 hypothetical protein [Halomonas taeanensis]
MATDNSNAIANDVEPQSSGDYTAFRERIAELAMDSDVQKAFTTTSVDAATQGAAKANINQAARLLPDGWMSGSLGIDDLAAQMEAGRQAIATGGKQR